MDSDEDLIHSNMANSDNESFVDESLVDESFVDESSDDRDDPTLEVDIPPMSREYPTKTEDYRYEVLTTEQLGRYQREIIDEVNNILNLSPTILRMLLNYFKWDKEKLLEKYFENSAEHLFKCINMTNLFTNPLNNKCEMICENGSGEECKICFSNLSSDSMMGLECGHRFCLMCWREYVKGKIIHEGLDQSIVCAEHRCNMLMDDIKVIELLDDPDVRSRYWQLITNKFVQSNELLRWCPSPNCTYSIKVIYGETRLVRCKCGHQFCFICNNDWHDPVKCHWLKKWIEKSHEDLENCYWMATHSKPCPKCKAQIEKNGGCNIMICRNCSQEFCWVCMKCHGHGASCNIFNKEPTTPLEDLVTSLEKYKHYYNRYENHMRSLKYENNLHITIKAQLEENCEFEISYVETEFLKKAVKILCQCRQTLMYTYVFAYYLKKSNQSIIFETNQTDLEIATESLSDCLERRVITETLAKVKVDVLDKYRYCETRRKVLLHHVYEGYENDTWDYVD